MPETAPVSKCKLSSDLVAGKSLDNPRVCIVDEDRRVQETWEKSLGSRVRVHYFSSPGDLLEKDLSQKFFLDSMVCIVMGRLFNDKSLDIVRTEYPARIRRRTSVPVFLNWQGYIDKNDLETNFDGKIYQRYGVKWVTLRHRILRLNRSARGLMEPVPRGKSSIRLLTPSRDQLCLELLKRMASNSCGDHQARLEHYAYHDLKTGIKLLEAVYNRLMTSKDIPTTCPSRYLNSSPVIAARIIEKALILPL